MHIKNDSKTLIDQGHPDYNKLVKIRWLVKKDRERCVTNWNLG